MKFKGHNIRITQPGREYTLLWRVYGTREVERAPDGVRPKPGTWEPVRDIVCEVRGDRYIIPDFELELTRVGGWRFYRMIGVRGGREVWEGNDTDLVFTKKMVEEFGGDVDWATLLLYNLELQGMIQASDWCVPE